MGTRHLIAIVLDNEIKVAQYNQWDGYPSGNGVKVLNRVRRGFTDTFKDKVRGCSWVTQEDIDTVNVTDNWYSKYPWLSRDCSVNIFKYISKSKNGLRLLDRRNFAGDSLFCEWGYVVDLDNSTLEVYSGFNKEPVPAGQRFTDVDHENPEYFPIKLERIYKFGKLPSKKTFLADLELQDDLEN